MERNEPFELYFMYIHFVLIGKERSKVGKSKNRRRKVHSKRYESAKTEKKNIFSKIMKGISKQNIFVKFPVLEKISDWLVKNNIYMISFFGTLFVLILLYITREIFPFGDRAYLRMDFYHQYAPYMKELYERIHSGQSLLFSWQNGFGLNFWALFGYYLASPFNLLILLWPADSIIEATNFFVVIKGALAALVSTFCLSRQFHTKRIGVAFFGCIYALSAYYLAYSCNIIWMDVFFLAPLVFYGIKRMAEGKGMEVYCVSMGLCALSNFYLAVILGFCCLLYFPLCLICKRHHTFKEVIKACGRFILGTVIAVSFAAIILIPAYLALKNTPSGGSTFPKEWESYFAFYEMLIRMAMNMTTNQNNGDLPNLYCSVLCAFLLPLYFSNQKIALRNKIGHGLIIVFLLFSFEWNVLDYIWHGLHFPNSFPARQSFFFIFLLIQMGYETFQKRRAIPKPAIIATMVIEIAGLILAWVDMGNSDIKKVLSVCLCSILWVLFYGVFFLIETKLYKPVFMISICLLLSAELVANTLITGMNSTVSREKYLEDDAVTAELLNYLYEKEGGAFYRMEEIDRKCVNDAAWDGYNGVSCFSSTIPGATKNFMEKMGHRTSNVSYSFQGATPFTTSLFGIKYIFSENRENLGMNYEETGLTLKSGELYLYENKNVLPLGMVVQSPLLEDMFFTEKNPFENQNQFVSELLQRPASLYTALVKEIVRPDDSFQLAAGAQKPQELTAAGAVKFSVPGNRQAFIYVTSYLDEIKVTEFAGEAVQGEEKEYDDLKFKRILDLGISDKDRVFVVSSEEAKDTLNLYAYMMNQEVLEDVISKLRENSVQIQSVKDTSVKAYTNGDGGRLVFSIPYDSGFRIYMDGEETECKPYLDAFVSCSVPAGEHEIEIKYMPPGFVLGSIISVFGMIAMVLVILRYRKNVLKKG